MIKLLFVEFYKIKKHYSLFFILLVNVLLGTSGMLMIYFLYVYGLKEPISSIEIVKPLVRMDNIIVIFCTWQILRKDDKNGIYAYMLSKQIDRKTIYLVKYLFTLILLAIALLVRFFINYLILYLIDGYFVSLYLIITTLINSYCITLFYIGIVYAFYFINHKLIFHYLIYVLIEILIQVFSVVKLPKYMNVYSLNYLMDMSQLHYLELFENSLFFLMIGLLFLLSGFIVFKYKNLTQ